MTKRNDRSTKFGDWTTRKLKCEAQGLDHMIYGIGCYSVRDILMLSAILAELGRRGFEPVQNGIKFIQK